MHDDNVMYDILSDLDLLLSIMENIFISEVRLNYVSLFLNYNFSCCKYLFLVHVYRAYFKLVVSVVNVICLMTENVRVNARLNNMKG